MRKLKISFEEAREILADIVKDHENVHFWKNQNIIYIEGFEPKEFKPKRKSKFIDITKP